MFHQEPSPTSISFITEIEVMVLDGTFYTTYEKRVGLIRQVKRVGNVNDN